MATHLKDKEELFLLLSQKTLVLTPNNRLSEVLLQQYFVHSKKQTLDKPKCMPFRVALIKAYEQFYSINPQISHPTLLSSAQCQYLWRKIIHTSRDITYSEGLLQSVLSAWERCELWQIDPSNSTFGYTAQTQQFQQWWQLFDQQLKQQHLITEYQLISYLLNSNNSLFPQNIVWACFDDFTPQQMHLQDNLSQKGFIQYQYDLQEKTSQIELLAAQDKKEEHQQLMKWLALKTQEGNTRIGVVVPNLEDESRYLQRILTDHFEPSLFNISLGQSLKQFPLVAHALCWLNLEEHQLNPHQVALLLQSPYLGAAKEEFIIRSEYLHEGKLLENHSIPLSKLIEELTNNAPELARLLSNLISYPQEATVFEWIHLFQQRLKNLGFPGDSALNSENYQCFNRFLAVFDELRQFALIESKLNQADALELIRQIIDNTIFQAQKTNAIIQVSGLLEASGCEFDSLWIMNLTDQCLPQKVHLSAFIPPQLQRDLCMPHSLPARELHFARQIVQRFQSSADNIVFSYAQLQADTPNLPCSLITEFPAFERLPSSFESTTPELMQVEECVHIPLEAEEHFSGGTAILSNQAKCPFKAFAEHRLRAKKSSETTDGLDNRERGQIIHKVMELLWKKLENQYNLLHIDAKMLQNTIDEAIHTALTSLNQQQSTLFPDSILEVENLRLRQLVQASLDWEKQRTPFAIAALEQSFTIDLAGLEFKVRVDRLDQVGDKKWVIDYKSTLPSSRPWNEERPKEPQLLFYALLDEQINTLLLLQLKTGQISCAGLSEEKQNIRGISSLKKEDTWMECRDTWKQQLVELATEFKEGYCLPQPIQVSLCQQCEFQDLCRFQAED